VQAIQVCHNFIAQSGRENAVIHFFGDISNLKEPRDLLQSFPLSSIVLFILHHLLYQNFPKFTFGRTHRALACLDLPPELYRVLADETRRADHPRAGAPNDSSPIKCRDESDETPKFEKKMWQSAKYLEERRSIHAGR
jgi:hypothetical protein